MHCSSRLAPSKLLSKVRRLSLLGSSCRQLWSKSYLEAVSHLFWMKQMLFSFKNMLFSLQNMVI